MGEINNVNSASILQAYHHKLDMNQFYVDKQRIVEHHNKLKRISNEALDAYNDRLNRAKEAQLQIYNRQGKFVNQISQIPDGKSIDIEIR